MEGLFLISLGEKLRRLRLNNGLTQEDVGRQIGVTDKAISRYENDQAEPDLQLFRKIATLYNVDPNYLLNFYSMGDRPEHMEIRHGESSILEAYRKCDKVHQKIIKNLLKEFANIKQDSDEALGFIHED